MKPLAYLAPNLALFLVLYRMAAARLHTERSAVFVFLCAWFLYSVGLVLVTAVFPVSSASFARIYLFATAIAWAAGAPALWKAGARVVMCTPGLAWIVAAALMLAAWMAHAVWLEAGITPVTAALIGSCWMSVAAGALFAIASVDAEMPDLLLWRGLGAAFLFFGFGTLWGRLLSANYQVNLAALVLVTASWAALAWHIAPTADGIFNLEKLALMPAARRAFGFLKSSR